MAAFTGLETTQNNWDELSRSYIVFIVSWNDTETAIPKTARAFSVRSNRDVNIFVTTHPPKLKML